MLVLRLAVFFMGLVRFGGLLVLVALTLPIGMNNAMGIIGAVAIGTVLAIPAAYIVAKKMSDGMQA